MGSETVVVALFEQGTNARSAYQSLRGRGIPEENLNLAMSDATRAQHFVADTPQVEPSQTPAPPTSGASANGAIGAAFGTALGAGLGTMILPGLGSIAGAAAGGSIGALFGFNGVDTKYQQTISSGGVMLGVKLPASNEDKDEIVQELIGYGAKEVTTPNAV